MLALTHARQSINSEPGRGCLGARRLSGERAVKRPRFSRGLASPGGWSAGQRILTGSFFSPSWMGVEARAQLTQKSHSHPRRKSP